MEIANMRDNKAFPDLFALPYQHVVDFSYWAPVDNFMFNPKRHWCFLGEVISETFSQRLEVYVKDRSGALAPIAFDTSELGLGFVRRGEMKIGHTIAILYPEKFIFDDSTVGIRQVCLETIKMFPVSIDAMLQLNDRLQEFCIVKDDALHTCHNCQRKAIQMLRCGKCTLFYYCNKECQVAAWTDKGHKEDCKLLRDPELRDLLLLDYESFGDYHQFSTTFD
ncbi:hypothetical protein CP533_2140 [Ophiocordyceps camponoti-saundersi (nom. inval.)]|nr:hypothetical protein CP533_2140 [Ophiocordyceps camponoti-saundersi (nom. inval.)]